MGEVAYQIVDCEARRHQAGAGFAIPYREERRALRVGDKAKLIFEARPGLALHFGERLWVEIKEVKLGSYVGELRNHPVSVPGLTWGAVIEFEPLHVCAIIREEILR